MKIVCPYCHRVWTGTGQCHCRECHRHFSGKTAFDAHWVGAGPNRHCADPASLSREDGNPLLVLEERTHWKSDLTFEVWTMWKSPEEAARFATLNQGRRI